MTRSIVKKCEPDVPKKLNSAPRPRKLSMGHPSPWSCSGFSVFTGTVKLGKLEIAGGRLGVRVKLAAGQEWIQERKRACGGIDNIYPAEVV